MYRKKMSENMYKDYNKAENSDDEETYSDLQARLYAEIYYDSNIGSTSNNNNIAQTTQHDDIVNKTTIENLQHKSNEKEATMSEDARDKFSKKKTMTEMSKKHFNQDNLLSKHCSIIRPLACDDTLSASSSVYSQITKLTDNQEFHSTEPVSVSVQTSRDTSTIPDTTDAAASSDSANYTSYENNETSDDLFVIEERKKRSSKKHKFFKQSKSSFQARLHKDNTVSIDELDTNTKYNVLQKKEKTKLLLAAEDKQAEKESSDSDDSIYEVPIPPKPQPLLVDLQDSDNEDTINLTIDEDDLLMEKLCSRGTRTKANSRISTSSPEVEVIEVYASNQSTSSRNRTTINPMYKDTFTRYNRSGYNVHEINEDIVLNCTKVQKGARSISEVRCLRRSARQAAMNHMTSEDTNRDFQETTQQSTLRQNNEDNSYILQETCTTSSVDKWQMRRPWMNLNADDMTTKGDAVCDGARNYRRADQDLTSNTSVEISCNDSNLIMNRKRYSDTETTAQGSFAQKRQHVVQQSDPSTMLMVAGSSNNGGRTKGRRDRSFWQNYFFKPLPEEVKRFYNDSRGQENFDISELQRGMSRDPRIWRILDEDLMPSPASKRCNRYWKPVKCSYCQQEGHLRRDCTEPFKSSCCHMCGTQGHIEKHCPQKVCLTCGKKQSSFRKTCEYCRILYCTMCKSVGHKAQHCPDLWRRYHQTTIDGDIPLNPGDIMKPPNQLYCCNCAKRGHEVSVCREYRWSLHFTTPTAVTNYTDGPTYSPKMLPNVSNPNAVESGLETMDISSLRTSGSPISLQRPRNLSEAETRIAHFPNMDASPTNAKANKQIPQGIACTPKISKGTVFSPTMVGFLSKMDCHPTKRRPTGIQTFTPGATFTKIIYSCGTLQENNMGTRVMMKNLFVDDELSSDGKQFISCNLACNGKVFPVFLETLQKQIMFKVTIGWMKTEYGLMLELKAQSKKCLDLLCQILFHWFNLPHDEKSYGLNINLPRNPKKMLEFLEFKVPLSKGNMNIKFPKKEDIRDPLELFHEINDLKATINKSTDQDTLTRLWDLQTKLLMIVNTQTKTTKTSHISLFTKYLAKVRYSRRKEKTIIPIITYLQIILHYNHLFVPHTPKDINQMINRALCPKKGHIKWQTMEKPWENKQNDFTNASHPMLPDMTFCTSQDLNSIGNISTVVDTQNANVYTSSVIKDNFFNDIPLEISNVTKNCTQQSQNIVSLNSQPLLTPLEASGKKEDQLSTGNIEITITNANAKPMQIQPLSKEGKKKIKEKKECYAETTQNVQNADVAKLTKDLKRLENLRSQAEQTVEKARGFKLPYLINAADDLQKKLEDGILHQKHIDALRKMIKIEIKYQKNMNVYYKLYCK